MDVTAITMGRETVGKKMTPVIPRNSKVPCQFKKMFYTVADNQARMRVSIYEGESPKTTDNNLLGEFMLSGIPPMPAGKAEVEDTWDLNVEGILTVTAVCRASGTTNNMEISVKDSNRLTDKQIDDMEAFAQKCKQTDDKSKDRKEAVNRLEALCFSLETLYK